ncbi:MAG: peptidase U37 [Alphaproteobacteria bacterium]|nr:peptidase U37 [Alphaproteobacteria bacterium]
MAPPKLVRHDLPPLTLRAAIRPSSADPDKRTVEIVWTTGARVLRGYWDRYYEELSLDPKHVRMGRLNNGAPFLDAHNGYQLDAVIGVVERAAVDGKQGAATIRFAKAEDDPRADQIFRKVRDGIIQNISVGYRIHKLEQVEGGDEEIPVYRAIDWEPFEISVVPMGADDGAGFRAEGRAGERYAPNPCDFVTREESTMDDDKDDLRERGRVAKIDDVLRLAKIDDPAFRDELVDSKVSLAEARKRIIDRLATDDDKIKTQNHVRVGDDRADIGRRVGIRDALLHRANPTAFPLTDAGRQFRGLPLLEMGRACVEAVGVTTRGMSKREAAAVAIGLDGRTSGFDLHSRAGYHSTSDFPLILADVAGKTLRKAYDESPSTFRAFGQRTTLPDFKDVKRTQLGEAPSLKLVIEGAEYTRGTIGEGRESYHLMTYGRVIGFSRQGIINDDMDAFSRIPRDFGRSARLLESDLVYSHFLSNPVMADTKALFHVDHNNTGSGLIGTVALGAARAAMRQQKGLDGEQLINVVPRFLLVPAALETTAEQALTVIQARSIDEANPFGGKLELLVEPRLDGESTAEWYVVASPANIDTLEYAYLEGEEAPYLETRVGFDVDGLEIKCRHDFGTKAIDWRGFFQSDGVVV